MKFYCMRRCIIRMKRNHVNISFLKNFWKTLSCALGNYVMFSQLDGFDEFCTSEETSIHYFLIAHCLFTTIGLGTFQRPALYFLDAMYISYNFINDAESTISFFVCFASLRIMPRSSFVCSVKLWQTKRQSNFFICSFLGIILCIVTNPILKCLLYHLVEIILD